MNKYVNLSVFSKYRFSAYPYLHGDEDGTLVDLQQVEIEDILIQISSQIGMNGLEKAINELKRGDE